MALNLHQSIYSEIADFLVSEPSLSDLASYHVPPTIQLQIDLLLEKNAEGQLATEEHLELEKILAIANLMDLMKVRAKRKLATKA